MSTIADAIAAWVARRHPAAAALAAELAAARLEGHTALALEERHAAAARELHEAGLVALAHGQVAWTACAAAEGRIAATLRRLAALPPGPAPPVAGGDPAQDAAVALVASRRLAVITGGPGTGKTTTVLRALAALLDGDPGVRIAVCAPTGKAAARLRAAMERGIPALPRHGAELARVAAAATTLHRLLGWNGRTQRFRHRPEHRLPLDAVVVDEASMLDIHLAAALCQALDDGARLVLVGDDGQLPSVEAGAVLRDLCAAGSLAACRVRLATVHRQAGSAAGLRALAPALRAGDAAATEAVLAAGHADLVRLPHAGAWAGLWPRLEPWTRAVTTAADPAAALHALAGLLVLCAHREGPWSVADLHRRIEAGLGARADGVAPLHRHGRPLLVTANDHATGLANGDLGVLWDDGGGLVACFPDGTGGVRRLAAARLPPCDTGWAITVHKAQGSEAAEAVVVLPPEAHPLASRELLYTAATRARERLVLVADAALTAAALERRERRTTGLAGSLG